MSGRESREEQARRALSDALAASWRRPNRRPGSVRVTIEDHEQDGRQVFVDDGHGGQVHYPTREGT